MTKVRLLDGRTGTIIEIRDRYYLVHCDQLQPPIITDNLYAVQASPLEWHHKDYLILED